jgi:hypothetical protein
MIFPRLKYISLVVLIGFSQVSIAELFKWSDENGKVHYSDKQPELSNSNIAPFVNPFSRGKTPNTLSKAIVRPYELTVRKLFLPDTLYGWRKTVAQNKPVKIGVYYAGKGCTSRGAMKTPEVFITHRAFFPTESDIAFRIKKMIKSLDYEAEKSSRFKLQSELQESRGLSLHSEIEELNFETCAPGIATKDRFLRVSQISAYKFTRHRVKLKIRWQLKTNRGQQLLHETVTNGQYNGWNISSTPKKALMSAVESAVISLFSQQQFIAKIIDYTDGPNEKSKDESKSSKILNTESLKNDGNLSNIIQNKMILKAQLSSVLSDMSHLKILSAQHYLESGEWPGSFSEIGLSESMFAGSKTVSDMTIQSDGSILAELRELFGENKILQLIPLDLDYGVNAITRWQCISNLSQDLLPMNCETM